MVLPEPTQSHLAVPTPPVANQEVLSIALSALFHGTALGGDHLWVGTQNVLHCTASPLPLKGLLQGSPCCHLTMCLKKHILHIFRGPTLPSYMEGECTRAVWLPCCLQMENFIQVSMRQHPCQNSPQGLTSTRLAQLLSYSTGRGRHGALHTPRVGLPPGL